MADAAVELMARGTLVHCRVNTQSDFQVLSRQHFWRGEQKAMEFCVSGRRWMMRKRKHAFDSVYTRGTHSMGSTIAQKILAAKAGRASVRPGEIVKAFPDLVMSHAAPGDQ